MARNAFRGEGTPDPGGPYSPAVRIGTLVSGAGQVGVDASGAVADGVAAQTRLALRNLLANLNAAGASAGDVISVRVFLTDAGDFAAMNEVYVEHFDDPYPTRTTVYVGLPPGLLVEIDALAVVAG